MTPIYDWQDRHTTLWEKHLAEDCLIKQAGKEPFSGAWHQSVQYTCCDKAKKVNGTCVCAYVLCCPDHGHQCCGTHD